MIDWIATACVAAFAVSVVMDVLCVAALAYSVVTSACAAAIAVLCVAALLVSVVIAVLCVAALANKVVMFVVAVPRLASMVLTFGLRKFSVSCWLWAFENNVMTSLLKLVKFVSSSSFDKGEPLEALVTIVVIYDSFVIHDFLIIYPGPKCGGHSLAGLERFIRSGQIVLNQIQVWLLYLIPIRLECFDQSILFQIIARSVSWQY